MKFQWTIFLTIKVNSEEIKEKLGDFENIITLTAEFAIGIHKIFEVAEKYLSNDVWFYPEDYYTDLPVNKIVLMTVPCFFSNI